MQSHIRAPKKGRDVALNIKLTLPEAYQLLGALDDIEDADLSPAEVALAAHLRAMIVICRTYE